MTKKDYELIARSVLASFADFEDFGLKVSNEDIEEMHNHVVDNLIMAFEADNPRFDRNKFLEACGVKD